MKEILSKQKLSYSQKMKLKYCKVISDYKSPYIDPLKIRKGEILRIGNKESEWSDGFGARIKRENKDGYQEIIWISKVIQA